MLAGTPMWLTILFLSFLLTSALSQGCGGSIDAGAGVIQSPNYPQGYPPSDCVWIIQSDSETKIRIKFKLIDCSGDSLLVYDGNGTTGVPLLGQFCLTDPPDSIKSSGRLMTIKFLSVAGADNRQGFSISYKSKESRNRNPSCNRDLAFIEEPEDLEPREGVFVELQCRVNDYDAAISWFKDGQILDQGLNQDGIIVTRDNGLIIPRFDSGHQGHYACVVLSGDTECLRAEANVGESRNLNPSCNPDLAFIEELEDLEPREGVLVELQCRVNDNDAVISWFKDGQTLDRGFTGDGIIVTMDNGVIIPRFDSGHQGHYACVVLTGDTECLRAEGNITLNPLGFFLIVPENVIIDPNVGNPHIFNCIPQDDTWSVSWEKDGGPMENPTTVDGQLLLHDISEEDEGRYTCVIRDPWNRSKGRADAWLYLSESPQLDISTTCGTITFGRDEPTPSLDSFDWSRGEGPGRIVGGNIANHGSAPFMVQITEFKYVEWIHRCGATLLDQSWILTAASCMFKAGTRIPIPIGKMSLVFGQHDTEEEEESEKRRPLAEIIIHEEYNHTNYDNNIALIRIEPPLREFTPYIRPICLAPSGLSRRLFQSDNLGRVTGWGRLSPIGPVSRFLKEVEVPFVDRPTCRQSIEGDGNAFTANMFCAGYHNAGQDACSGDSGGPLAVRYDDGRWYQLGIVSWGIGCAARGEYGFYTRVSHFLDWIHSKEATVAYSPNVGKRFNESLSNDVLAFKMRSPSHMTVAEGSEVELECVPNRSDAAVEWFIGNSQVHVPMLEEGVRILRSGLVFHFDAMEESYSGSYSCMAMVNDEYGEQTIRATFQLALNPLGYFRIVPENITIDPYIEDPHIFKCTPQDDMWSVSWERDGEPMDTPITIDGNLLLLDITEEDEGRYTCVVSDPWSRSEGRADAWLSLSEPELDISSTCGTITFWRDTDQPTPSPEDNDDSFEWSSSLPEEKAPSAKDGDSFEWSSSTGVNPVGGRVVGGYTANQGSAPFMVQIREFKNRQWIHRCGATLLDQSWVLTAASCMFNAGTRIPTPIGKMNLVFGQHDTEEEEESEMRRRLAEIIVHEEYNHTNFDNDIALIRIEWPLMEFTPYIRPVCLAPSDLSNRLMQSGALGRVNGWGTLSSRGLFSRFLREVEVPFVDRKTCRQSIEGDGMVFTASMFCAGYHFAERDPCRGDSGGPLAVRYDDGRWYQLGIVSWGIGCAARGEYGFYTDVSHFLDWIRSKEATVAYSPNVEKRFNESLSNDMLAFTMRSPSHMTVAEGSEVELECVPNRSDVSVQWFIGNRPVDQLVPGVRILPSGLVFHFDAIEEFFSGTYACEARVSSEFEPEQTIRATFQLEVTPA